jgi:hypothetical protein
VTVIFKQAEGGEIVMRSRRRFLLPLLVLGLFAPVSPAAARQLDAFDRPRVSGPLILDSRDCGRRRIRNEAGTVVALAKSCIRFYFFDPSQESNAARNYGVIWLQTNLEALHRYCATSVLSDIEIPTRTRVHVRKPDFKRAAKRRADLTRLVVDAQDGALQNATIRQPFVMHPRKILGRVRENRTVFRTAWFGSSGRKLAFVSGTELSWRDADGPPNRVSSRLGFRVKRRIGGC